MTWAIEEKSYSQARACTLIGLAPKTYRYVSERGSDEAIRSRLRELAHERRRFGYRRLHLLLGREGIRLNRKKLYRIYKEERLTVRKRGGRKKAFGTRAPMTVPQGINQRWSLDFVSDALADSRRFRILAVIDDFSRECLALVADNSLSSSATTARNSPRTRSWLGRRNIRSSGTTSRRASQCRMALQRALSAAFATNA